jgi:hypothetical protein
LEESGRDLTEVVSRHLFSRSKENYQIPQLGQSKVSKLTNIVELEKLPVVQLLKNFPAFY